MELLFLYVGDVLVHSCYKVVYDTCVFCRLSPALQHAPQKIRGLPRRQGTMRSEIVVRTEGLCGTCLQTWQEFDGKRR